MELQVIPFRAAHMALVNPNVPAEIMRLAVIAENESVAKTLCVLGDPVGCAGVRFNDDARIGEAWALFSPVVKRMPLGLFRAVTNGMREVIAQHRLDSIIAIVDPKDLAAQRFMEHLGFPRERRQYLYQMEIKPWHS